MDDDFVFDRHGIQFQLPSHFEIHVDLPHIIGGRTKLSNFVVATNLTAQQGMIRVSRMEEQVRQMAISSRFGVQVIRSGPLLKPFAGWEMVLNSYLEGASTNIIMRSVLLYPGEGRCLQFEITSRGPVPCQEDDWDEIILTLRVDFSKLVRLKRTISVVTENNMFMIGPKEADLPLIDVNNKEDEQGLRLPKIEL